jgi:hypothetical protein
MTSTAAVPSKINLILRQLWVALSYATSGVLMLASFLIFLAFSGVNGIAPSFQQEANMLLGAGLLSMGAGLRISLSFDYLPNSRDVRILKWLCLALMMIAAYVILRATWVMYMT